MSTPISIEDLSEYSITTGEVFSPSDAYLVVTDDSRLRDNPDDDHSYFLRVRRWDDLRLIDSGWPVRSQARSSVDPSLVLSVGARGRVRATRADTGGTDEASIHDGLRSLKKTRTVINDVFDVFGYFCAVGSRRAVYRRVSVDQWENFDEGCYDAKAFEAEFTALVGVDGRALYAVGTLGEIWRFDGVWTREESGTNQDLNTACVDANGLIYAAGANGICLRGKNGSWVEVADPADSYDYWSIVEYQGNVYASANLSLILRLDKSGSFVPVDFGDCPVPGTAYHLKVRDGLMYSFGPKDIRRFDGQEWEELITL